MPAVRRFIFTLKIALIFSLSLPFQAKAQDTYNDQVQEMYVAYYGRPGDPTGLGFWANKLDVSGGELAEIIDEFGTSSEYTERFGSLNNETLINEVYLQLLGRDADAGGLSFYLSKLLNGEMTLATIALNVINGVEDSSDDADIVDNKLTLANAYTQAVDDGVFEYTSAEIDSAKALLASVDGTSNSLSSAILELGTYGDNEAVVTDGSKNILLIIGDDIGVDNISAYNEQPNFSAQTPNIDGLATSGVLFRNTWANPKCSPSRASLLTGRHAFRHGVTHPGGIEGSLSGDEETIAEAVSAVGYSTALFGKWHLGKVYPTDQGFDYFSGSLDNLDAYFGWEKTQISAPNAEPLTSVEASYATQVVAEEALAWIEQANGPWFVQVAFNAPHSPYHVPPSNRFSHVSLSGSEGDACTMNVNSDDTSDCYRAAAEALDSYIGELLASINPAILANTLIIFVGDNGTPGDVVIEEDGLPFISSHAKGTVYEGGVNVPLIITGGANMGIDSTEVSDNIQIQDIFSTVLSLANATPSSSATIDGQSLLGYIDTETSQPSARDSLYTELSSTGQGIDRWAASNGEAKYIFNEDTEECYNLNTDPGELTEQYEISGSSVNDCDTLKAARPQ